MSTTSISIYAIDDNSLKEVHRLMGECFWKCTGEPRPTAFFGGLHFSVLGPMRLPCSTPYGKMLGGISLDTSENHVSILEWYTFYIVASLRGQNGARAVAIKESGPTLCYLQDFTIYVNASEFGFPGTFKTDIDFELVSNLPIEGECVNLADYLKSKSIGRGGNSL